VFQVTYRPALGIKQKFSEPLENYVGVRLRVLFTQVGLINKNKYVIDLFHYDSNKIIPLYISTINMDIRKIWEAYAKMFKLPALSVGDRGLVQRDFNDLNKSIKELATENKLPYIAGGKFPAPNTLDIVETGQSTIVKPTGIYWDFINKIYLSFAVIISIILTSAGVYMTLSGKLLPTQYLAYASTMLLIAIYCITKLFKSYRLDIYDDRIVITKMLFDSPVKADSSQNNSFVSNSRASAGINPPGRIIIISPTTTFFASIVISLPFLITVAVGDVNFFRASIAFSLSETINLKIPYFVVSAIDNARMLMFSFANVSIAFLILPSLFSTKIEICLTAILSPIQNSFHLLHEQLYLRFLEVIQVRRYLHQLLNQFLI
jgi:hypothetical protein